MLPDKSRPKDLEPVQVSKPRPTRVANIFITIAFIILAFSLGLFLKWSFQNEEVLRINNEPFPTKLVVDESHDTGGILVVTVDYCKTQAIEGSLRVSYLSKSTEYFIPLTKERGEKGCKKTDLPIVIPRDLPTDKYRLKFRVTYDVNPLKKGIISEFFSEEFEVGSQSKMVQ